MADIADQHDQASAADLDESHAVGNGTAAPEARGIKRQRPSAADDDDDDEDKVGRERRKIEIKFISDKSRRHITFSKRKAGIMKKVRLLFSRKTKHHQLPSSRRGSSKPSKCRLSRSSPVFSLFPAQAKSNVSDENFPLVLPSMA
jgi:MADS-box transcription factor